MLVQQVIKKIKTKHIAIGVVVIILLKLLGIFTHLFEEDFNTAFRYPYDGNIEKSVQQLRYNSKPDIPVINSYDYEFIKNCNHKCKQEDGNVLPLRLMFLIKSSPTNFNRRLLIRHTWGYESRFSDVEVRTVFLLGVQSERHIQNKINYESQQFSDIVQINFEDSYFNNTIKTMMGFKWAVQHCAESKFYMFVDDDYYVSLKNVLRFVRNPANYPQYLEEPIYSINANKKPSQQNYRQIIDFELPDDVRLYAGYVFVSSPHRHITSKWYVTLEDYSYNMWPPYVTAGAYVLSKEALLDMYYTSFYTKHFRFDDIYVGLLAKKANIEPLHCEEFYFYQKKYKPHDYRYTVASHGYSDSEQLSRVWNEQKKIGNA